VGPTGAITALPPMLAATSSALSSTSLTTTAAPLRAKASA
jgi:hypothetical protein